jgi:PIN domain nuclease of toxin-antitoxin system
VILLDTNALLWVATEHRRAKPLARLKDRLCVSPATLLELQFLVELGRLRLARGVTSDSIAADPRWVLDDLSAAPWFAEAASVTWTHDPFDRLIVAHARVRRHRLATADSVLLEHLPASAVVEL